MGIRRLLHRFSENNGQEARRSEPELNFEADRDKGSKALPRSARQVQSVDVADPKPQGGDCCPPPTYSPVDERSIRALLQVTKDTNRLGGDHGIRGGLNMFYQRDVRLIMDNNDKQRPTTMKAHKFLASYLLNIGKASGSNMEISFTNYSNPNNCQLTDEEQSKAHELETVRTAESWGAAKRLVQQSKILKEMGLEEFINKLDLPEKGQLEREAQEKFDQLLCCVRSEQNSVRQIFHQRKIDPDKLRKEYDSAVQESKKQPALSNSLYFTVEREVQRYLRLKSSRVAKPTTVILLTGSPLQMHEAKQIIALQSRKTAKKAEGDIELGGGEFCIQIVAMTENMDEEALLSLRYIDNAYRGNNDIHDVTEIKETKLVTNGPSPALLYKMLNPHNRRVDDLKQAESDKYGRVELMNIKEDWTPPTSDQVAAVLDW